MATNLRSPEVTGRDGLESLLTGGVPDLQLHALAVNVHVLDLEINADGCDEGRREGVAGVADEQTRFADACRTATSATNAEGP